MLKILHCLDTRLTDGGKVVRARHRPHSAPKKLIFLLLIVVSVSG
jgi:hypothetical protein